MSDIVERQNYTATFPRVYETAGNAMPHHFRFYQKQTSAIQIVTSAL